MGATRLFAAPRSVVTALSPSQGVDATVTSRALNRRALTSSASRRRFPAMQRALLRRRQVLRTLRRNVAIAARFCRRVQTRRQCDSDAID